MKIKKYIACCCLLPLSMGWVQAQLSSVSINSQSGKVLVVDPLGNTVGNTGTADDVVVLSNGNVGLGTHTPTVKLDIKGTLRIADGTQSNGAFYVSDANGIGSWYDSNFIGRRVVWGGVLATKTITAAYQDITSIPLDLTGGLWMIVAKADITGALTSPTLATTDYVWLKIVEEVTNTNGTKTYTDISEGGLPFSIRKGVYQKYYSTPMVQGFLSIPVEGIGQKKRKYYVYAKSPSATFTSPQLTNDLTGAYLYAIKLQ